MKYSVSLKGKTVASAVTYFDKKDTLCNTSCLLKDVHFVIRAAVVSYRHIIMYTIFKELSY